MSATDLVNLCESGGLPIPGFEDGVDTQKAAQKLGSMFGKVFQQNNGISISGFRVEKTEVNTPREDNNGTRLSKRYTFYAC